MDVITALRTQIDELDNQLMILLEKRYDLSLAIGEEKMRNKRAIMDSTREQQIFEKISQFSHYPQITEVYKTIISESRSLQRK